MNNKSTPKVLNFIVIVGIIITCILLLISPLIVTAFLKSQFSIVDNNLLIKIVIALYLCSIPYLISLFKLKSLSSLIIRNTPFSWESVSSLKTISICSFSEIVIFAASITYLKETTEFFKYLVLGGPIIVITFVCVTIGFLCLVLSQLFEMALEIKEENDKTI